MRLESALEDKLRYHDELEQIASDRRKDELSESPEVSETFEKFIEDMVKKHPLLEQILGPGFRIANPFKPLAVEVVEKPGRVSDSRRNSTFGVCSPVRRSRDANLNSQVRVTFETDAENDYFPSR